MVAWSFFGAASVQFAGVSFTVFAEGVRLRPSYLCWFLCAVRVPSSAVRAAATCWEGAAARVGYRYLDEGAAPVLKSAAACIEVSLAARGIFCGCCPLVWLPLPFLWSRWSAAASFYWLIGCTLVCCVSRAILSHRVSLLGFCVLGSIYLNSGGMKVLSNGGYRSLNRSEPNL